MNSPSHKKYELIIFDFDGTLVDTVEDIAFYANSVLAEYGYASCSVRQAQNAIGWGVHELLKGVAPGFIGDASRLEEAVNLFKKRYREQPIRKTAAFGGVREALNGPLASLKKAIVTNKPQDITQQILEELKLDHYFEMTIGMHAGFEPKPDPSAAHHVMRSLKTSAEKTLFIGDSGVDAQAARNAGIDFAWVSYGYDQPENINAVACFASADEWRKLI